MTATLLDGKALAQRMQAQMQIMVERLTSQVGRSPGLAVLMVGDHPASAAYVRNKERACHKVGFASFGQHFSADIPLNILLSTIQDLNQDPRVDGILVQLPLPDHLDATQALLAIDPDKDADGLHPVNLGRLVRGEAGIRSCTPYGVMQILADAQIELAGKQAVVIGRSTLVGKPIALMLLEANATVVMAHSRTPDLATLTRSADILVVAAGKPQLVLAEMVNPGSVVIDVGINRIRTAAGESKLVGDVDFESVRQVAGSLTPVPGGVGPMTVTMLLHNTLSSYLRRHNLSGSDLNKF